MFWMKSVFAPLLLITCLLSSSLSAEETRWYKVELIAFAQNSENFRASEQWSVDHGLPSEHRSEELRSVGSQRDDWPAPFARLSNEDLELRAEAQRIERDGALTLLLHQGWYQPGLPAEQARGVRIRAVDNELDGSYEPARLEGVISVSLARYLHVNADLIYRERRRDYDGKQTAQRHTMADLFELGEDGPLLMPLDKWQVYRMQESRRMRSDELHYLDHPLFGLLVRITRHGH